jgi:hypothetical protein
MLLLNVCCAPCSLPVIDHLLKKGLPSKELALYFFGPNIYPKDEYSKRLEAARGVASIYGLEFFTGEYEHEEWLEYIKLNLSNPPESYPENSARCLACFAFRIDRTAAFSREKSIDEFALTLSVSRFKDVGFVNSYGETAAIKNGLDYMPLTLDAEQAHQLGLRLSKEHGVYRQKYCGCEFSLKKGS